MLQFRKLGDKKRSYARSVSLRESQINRLRELGVENLSELFQKLLDDWLATRDTHELKRIRERVDLLTYKWRFLTDANSTKEERAEAATVMEEIEQLRSRINEIERNIDS